MRNLFSAGLLLAVGTALIAGIGLPLLQHFDRVAESIHTYQLAAAVGIGMSCAIAGASVLAMMVPHVFRKVGVDPAIASGPIVTTTNDIVCVTLYFLTGMAILQ